MRGLRPALKLQAAGVLLAVAVGWLYAPLALTRATLDVCSMSCCVSDGYCCCSPRHAHVAGEVQGDGDEIGSSEFSKSCPRECATSASFARPHLGKLIRPTVPGLALSQPAVSERGRPPNVRDAIFLSSSPPRGPPFLTAL
jgi:hypothetical protein